jgi:hypothetical protein
LASTTTWRAPEARPGLAAAAPAAAGREPRLDLFRGLAMLIILIAHIPNNPWTLWIPARFGPSDAAEMFVFCSGFAAALAFGGSFARAGWLLGTARILLRCWQIYWAHLCLFLVVAAGVAMADLWIAPVTGRIYKEALFIRYFFEETGPALVGLMTLTYVPNYFDILPMYMVVLLLTPIVVALQRVDLRLAALFCVALWLGAQLGWLRLPAEPFGDRPWFFNPFGWQLLFFTAFAFGRGWLVMPAFQPWLLTLAAVYVLFWIPASHPLIYPALGGIFWDVNTAFIYPAGTKTDFHLTRYLHLLALAYLALWLLRHQDELLRSPAMAPLLKVGQQALATFLTSMALAWALGVVLDLTGRGPLALALTNLGGLALVIGTAYLVAWFKSAPWRRRAEPRTPAPEA